MRPRASGHSSTRPRSALAIAASGMTSPARPKWEDAHRIALQLVEREDADAVAYTLLADALNGLERNDEALTAYRAALASLPTPLEESPDDLIARMEHVQRRIDAAKGKKE